MCKQCKISIDESHPGSAEYTMPWVDEWLEQCRVGKLIDEYVQSLNWETAQQSGFKARRVGIQIDESHFNLHRSPSCRSKKWPRAVMELASRDHYQNTDIDTIITRIQTLSPLLPEYRHYHHYYQNTGYDFHNTDITDSHQFFSRIKMPQF